MYTVAVDNATVSGDTELDLILWPNYHSSLAQSKSFGCKIVHVYRTSGKSDLIGAARRGSNAVVLDLSDRSTREIDRAVDRNARHFVEGTGEAVGGMEEASESKDRAEIRRRLGS